MNDFKEIVSEYINKEIPENSEIMYGTNKISRSEERIIESFNTFPVVYKKIIIEWCEVEE